jgi:hypothetical protein
LDTDRGAEKTLEPETAKKKKPYNALRLVRLRPGSREEAAAKVELAAALRKKQEKLSE